MSVQEKLQNFEQTRLKVLQSAGAQPSTARQRIEQLLDAGSFVEVDAFVERRSAGLMPEADVHAAGEGVVAGYGTIDERPVYIYSQDAAFLSGAVGEMHAKKIAKVINMAIQNGVPILSVIDSGGARIQEGPLALNGYGEIAKLSAEASGTIPQIAIVAGPCIGAAALCAALADFVFMVDGKSTLALNGPQVLQANDNPMKKIETIMDAKSNAEKSGNAHFIAESEEACFAQVKVLLSYLPSNNLEDAPINENSLDDINRQVESINELLIQNDGAACEMKSIIAALVDDGLFMEAQSAYAPNMITGFATFFGRPVGIVANQPMVREGKICARASAKAARFIRFCDSFGLPIITFVDTTGFIVDLGAEECGLVNQGAKLFYAYADATVPMITVVCGKATGSSYIAMGCKALGADMALAWPTAEISPLTAEAAANIVFAQELQSSADPIADRAKLAQKYEETFASPWAAAKAGIIDDVIMPSETRQRIIAALEMMISKRDSRPPKKHGNLPL